MPGTKEVSWDGGGLGRIVGGGSPEEAVVHFGMGDGLKIAPGPGG